MLNRGSEGTRASKVWGTLAQTSKRFVCQMHMIVVHQLCQTPGSGSIIPVPVGPRSSGALSRQRESELQEIQDTGLVFGRARDIRRQPQVPIKPRALRGTVETVDSLSRA